jgi:cyclic pyranopterin phosphate synthase
LVSNKKPAIVYWIDNTLYLNITNQCSNNCWFCFRNYKSGIGGFNLKFKREPNTAQVFSELEAVLPSRRWSEVVFCGFGEPTSRLDLLLEAARWIKVRIPTVPIRLNTNGHGYVLNQGRDVAVELKSACVSKTSVSLNGHNEETYGENCRPSVKDGFDAVLEFVRKSKASGLEVEVSALRMTEVDVRKVEQIANSLNVQFRIRDYIPCFW